MESYPSIVWTQISLESYSKAFPTDQQSSLINMTWGEQGLHLKPFL